MNGPASLSRPEVEKLTERHINEYFPGYTAQRRRRDGIGVVLDWLESTEGSSWQERWEKLGETSADWLTDVGAATRRQRTEAHVALQTLILERVIRPSYTWLLEGRHHFLYRNMRSTVHKEAFDAILAGAPKTDASGASVKQAIIVLGRIVVHTGKNVEEVNTADILDYGRVIKATGRNASGLRVAHQLLRTTGYLNDPPLTGGYTHRLNKLSVEQLVYRHGIECEEVRNLLVMYLEERAAALDYPSTKQLADRLAGKFWRDIELHHPGIDSIALPREVVREWRKRSEVLQDGRPRKDFNELFMVVRSFYLDILQWAAEDPERWKKYACPSPISASDIRAYRKARLQRRSRMHERIRNLSPLLPRLLTDVRRRFEFSRGLLEVASNCPQGQTFSWESRRFERLESPRAHLKRSFGTIPVMVRPLDHPGARAMNCQDLEDEAFWAWAVVEVLRLTGVRVEELLELTHLGVHRYRMPDGQRVLLLQIAPSKRDRERVLPVCPELAHVLATIVRRVRGPDGKVPLVERFDPLEKTMSAALPYLFQRRWRFQGAVMSPAAVGALLKRTSLRAGLEDKSGERIHFTPHDFRRLFATEAVNGGLPIHIAAKLLGHLDLNTTRGYVAVYSEEVIRHYRSHLARQRMHRPAAEYREPTEKEWEEFGKHFRRRKMALGDCYRPYGTDCPHEHACIRCPMLRMDSKQLPRLLQIEKNTVELLGEAREKGWEGEAIGLQETFQHIQEKKTQIDRITHLGDTDTRVDLDAKD